MVLGALAAVAVIACGLVLYRQFGSPERELRASAPGKRPEVLRTESPTAAAESATVAPGATATPSSPSAKSSADSTPDELSRLRLLPNDEYLKLWSTLYPYLVELTVRTPGETRRVAGVLVDSRGWVLTSLSAIRAAQVIEVRVAAKTFNSEAVTGELRDECRGLLAEDPIHDLALLEINRRLVTAFSNLDVDPGTLIVRGDTLIGATPPPIGEKIWLFDAPIRQAETRANLGEKQQARLATATRDEGPTYVWLVCGGPPERVQAGSPLFTREGKLAALLTNGSLSTEGLAATGAAIEQLRNRVHGMARPFPLELTGEAGAAASQAASDPRLAALETCAAAVRAVGAFGDQADKYEIFQTFVQALLDLDRELAEQTEASEIRHELERQLDGFQRFLVEQWTLGQFTVGAFNALAWERSAQDGTPFVAVALVGQTGLTAPKINGRDTVVFQLEQSDQKLVTPVARHHDIFLPGSRWLILGTSQAAAPDFRTTEPTPYSARRCQITRVFALDGS